MRLTLRTMLAYMDDILEPADAEDVGKKIAESEFASSLMHRMRDVVTRARLGAPKLQGRGMGLDPNTVAEYLDNKLPSDRVADFEKVCLESDVHLGEVAACHQILALILGEPAEIETTGKQRMYRLTTDPDAAPKKDHPAPGKPGDDIARARRRRKKKRRPVEVPDYLREPSEPEGRPRRVLALLVAAVLLAAGSYLAWIYWPRPGDVTVAGQPAGAGANEPRDGQPPRSNRSENALEQADVDTAGNGQARRVEDAAVEKGSAAAGASDEDNGSASDSLDDRELKPRNGKSARSTADRTVGPRAATTRSTQPSTQRAAENRSRPRVGSGALNQPVDDEESAEPATTDDARRPRGDRSGRNARGPAANDDDTEADDEPAAEAHEVGRLISEHDVLVRMAGNPVRRVPSRGTIYSGETLIALPTYRPSIVLSNGATLQLFGGTTVALAAVDDGVPEVELVAGHLNLMIVGRADTQMRLRVGDAQGTLTFGTADVSIAVEVNRKLSPGADPEADPATSSGALYVANGQIGWQTDGGPAKTVAREGRLAFDDGRVSVEKKADMPAWVEGDDLLPIERRASTAVDEALRAEQPVVAVLTELVSHRKEEISRLAVRCLALLGHFDAIVPLLGDKDRHGSAWATEIESLRAAIARGPQTAERVRKAFEGLHGKEAGDELYRMLWSYDAQQLADGGAAQLVAWLSHEELDFRVLSYWNLHHLTGFTQAYRPADSEIKRRTPTQKWRQKLEADMLVPKLPDEE